MPYKWFLFLVVKNQDVIHLKIKEKQSMSLYIRLFFYWMSTTKIKTNDKKFY
jgi:hypothetical protein